MTFQYKPFCCKPRLTQTLPGRSPLRASGARNLVWKLGCFTSMKPDNRELGADTLFFRQGNLQKDRNIVATILVNWTISYHFYFLGGLLSCIYGKNENPTVGGRPCMNPSESWSFGIIRLYPTWRIDAEGWYTDFPAVIFVRNFSTGWGTSLQNEKTHPNLTEETRTQENPLNRTKVLVVLFEHCFCDRFFSTSSCNQN